MAENSQGSDWVFTPPDSPGSLEMNRFRDEKELDFTAGCFHCMGQVSRSSHEFHPLGFIKSGVLKSPFIVAQDSDVRFKLFGIDFFFWKAMEEDSDKLFNLCRKSFMLLDIKRSESSDCFGSAKQKSENDQSCSQLRTNIYMFMNYILVYICSSTKYCERTEKLKLLIPIIELKLKHLRLLFHRLSFANLPKFVLGHFSSPQGNDCSSPVYHLVHSHLEVRWLYLNQLHQINNFKNEELIPSSQSIVNQDVSNFDENVLLLMSELIWLSVVKFEKSEDVPLTSCFSCVCVKELWLMLIHFLGLEKFWTFFNKSIAIVSDKTKPPENYIPNCSEIDQTNYLKCNNSSQFSLWMLKNVSKLYEYDCDGVHVENNRAIKTNFSLLEEIVRTFLQSDPSEATLRQYVPTIHSIMNTWGHEKSETVIYLWEYYHKKLNSSFYVPGSRLDGIQVSSKTASELIGRIRSRLNSSRHHEINDENSYSMFLRLLGTHLEQRGSKNLSSQKLCGRIFIKFPNSKVEKLLELSELGIHNVTSLYLTVAVVKDLEEVVLKLFNLMAMLLRVKLPSSKRTAAFKATCACLLLMSEGGANLNVVAEVLLKEVENDLEEKDVTDMPIFIDSLRVLFLNVNLKVSVLIGDWIKTYLRVCTLSDTCRLYSLFSEFILRLKDIGNAFGQCQQLKEKLVNHVLPTLTSFYGIEAAELAAAFSVLFLYLRTNNPELMALYNFWVYSEDVAVVSRYLVTLFTEGFKFDIGKLNFANYQADLIQCWIKCHLSRKMAPETSKLTSIVSNLPFVKSFSSDNNHNIDAYEDRLCGFINLFGIAYTNCQTLSEKSSLRKIFLTYFDNFDKWIVIDNKKAGDKELVDATYRYSGMIVADCYQLIYTRSDTRSLLKRIIDQLLMSPQIFKADSTILASVLPAIHNHLPLYIRGLVSLGITSDPYIQRVFRDLITQYYSKLSSYLKGEKWNHPFYQSVVDKKSTAVVVKILTEKFLVLRGRTPDTLAYNTVVLLQETLTEGVSEIIFPIVIGALLNIIILADEHNFTCEAAWSFLKASLDSNENRKHLLTAVRLSCEMHLDRPSLWFRFILRLVELCPKEVTAFLPELEFQIKKQEELRGINEDSILRNFLQKLKSRINS